MHIPNKNIHQKYIDAAGKKNKTAAASSDSLFVFKKEIHLRINKKVQ